MQFELFDETKRLHKVMLGTWFLPEYFDSIKSSNIKQQLQTIAHQTHEDLDNFESVLKSYGVEVYRPVAPSETYDPTIKINPALNVRDTFRTIGDTLYKFNSKGKYYDDAIQQVLPVFTDLSSILEDANRLEYLPKYSEQHYKLIAGSSWPSFVSFCNKNYTVDQQIQDEIDSYEESLRYDDTNPPEGPNVIITNGEIIVDHHEYVDFVNILKQHVPTNLKWKSICTLGGHTDGMFNLLNKDTVIGVREVVEKFMPHIPNKIMIEQENYQSHIDEFNKHKANVGGKWWVPGQENNIEFTDFVNNYLTHLVGYVEETQFDVNVLSLDEKTVFVMGDNGNYVQELANYGIEAIVVPWRHRWFHDGGLHCITLDLVRK